MGSGALTGQQASGTFASAGEGLVSRRKLRNCLSSPLQVITRRSDVVSKLALLTRLQPGGNKLRIRGTDNVEELYTLGAEVFPSTHANMEVRHARRLSDGENVVVKVREKGESFANSREEKEWRANMEFMLNLPKSGSIVQLYDVLEDSTNYYVVMEKAAGMDLFETLEFHGRLPVVDCKEILCQLLVAVAELHRHGCIHKDLKLENVMLDRAGRGPRTMSWASDSTASASPPPASPASPVVKLIDFDTVEEWTPQGSQKTPRNVVGTDQYIAQEAYAGKYSPASDIFAVGVIAYRMLTGKFPFRNSMFDDQAGENWVGSPKMNQIRERLQHFRIDFTLHPFPSEPLARDLCQSMLAVDEDDRPEAAKALQHPWIANTAPSPWASERCSFQAPWAPSGASGAWPSSSSVLPKEAPEPGAACPPLWAAPSSWPRSAGVEPAGLPGEPDWPPR